MVAISYIHEPDNHRIVAMDQVTQVGKVTYVKAGEYTLVIESTFVKSAYQGQGIAKELIHQIVHYAIENNLKLVPLCSFARSEFDKHPEYQAIEVKQEL